MPCTYTGSIEGDRALSAQENAEKLSKKNKQQITKLTELTRMLCTACKLLKKNKIKIEDSALSAWWTNHQIIDKKHKK